MAAMPKLTSTNHDAVRFGAILRRLRVARGWTLILAAQRCGMNPNYLGALEKGGNMPSVDTLLEMADVYSVNASDLVREVEEARRAARKQRAAAVIANMPPVE
jgi:transcriptional regulator with XRE-family HTH domain